MAKNVEIPLMVDTTANVMSLLIEQASKVSSVDYVGFLLIFYSQRINPITTGTILYY